MNKFAVACLMALALSSGLVVADKVSEIIEEMKVVDDDISFASEDGSEGLTKQQIYFQGFCADAEEHITKFVKTKVDEAKDSVYGLLLTTAQDIGRDVLEASKDTVKDAEKIVKESLPADASEMATTDERIEKTTENLPKSGLFQKIQSFVTRIISAFFEASRSAVLEQLNFLKEQGTAENLREHIDSACGVLLQELMPALDRKLTDAKKEIKTTMSSKESAAEITSMLKGVKIDNVGCKLTGRVSKVAKFCDILKLAGDTIYSLAGIN